MGTESKRGVEVLSTARLANTVNNAFMGEPAKRAIDRLLEWAARPGRDWSDAELARQLGHANQQRLSNWKDRDIARAEILPIAHRLGLNPIWLSTGTGPEQVRHAGETPAFYDASNPDDQPPLVFVHKVAGAIIQSGHGGISWTWEHEQLYRAHGFPKDWVLKEGLDESRLKIFENSGMSNWPWIMPGDHVLVHLDDRQMADSDDPTKNVFALQYGEHSRFKRIVPQHDGSVLLRSFNPDKQAYPDERVAGDELDSLAIIGRVVWRGG
jgi:phage repressor protein C with HTH and peptisase S24 domain